MPESYSFGVDPISCHSWNKERNQIAISLNSNEVEIHGFSGGRWTLKETLTDHAQRITGIDWSPKSNQIVTCAADRNAHVWTLTDGKWKPALVVLGITRAATCVKWSPEGNKFAVGSGNRSVSVCYFDSMNDWWTNKKIKKPIRSTITCLDWHKNNQLLACGSTDFKARVYSASMKEVNESPSPTSWGSKLTFANLLAEFPTEGGGWIHGISFSGSGDKLAWVGHDSSICVADSAKGNLLTIVKTEYLPFVDITWTSETALVVAGYDCVPLSYTYNNGAITFKAKIDADNKQTETKKGGAMAHFRTQDTRGTTDNSDTTLNSIHQNTITQISIHSGTKDKCAKFSTTAADGQLVIWDCK
ncbi:hypothetical protein HELRODRAFT_185993 [Helobdella robusta]|uniref:Actin-related protein 2/3 complex subunit n=1 Tax=Helobdella robusta TaxID=6412 RepID=T1FNJ1_HELRO|nr:hypothetical protein HELRODRAFT_185993 [Helobdella robusta]ESN95256.1 hypothetical protein HELRODRAFT_185993 [Helobdella robusta]